MKKHLLLAFALIVSLVSFAQEAERVKGEILIMLKPNTTIESVVNSANQHVGVLPSLKSDRLVSAEMRTWLLQFNEESISLREMLYVLQRTAGVQFAQANHIVRERVTTPDDSFYGQQWHHNENNDHDIDTDLAWDITTGGFTSTGDEIVACVVETGGAKWDQADILPNHWVNENEIPDNGIDDDENGYVDDYDGWNITGDSDNIATGNHGTQVSSMIGAKGNNASGITGVNWDVKIMQVQMGGISEANVVEAYTYPLKMRKLYNQTGGQRGAFVVVTNSSWGTDFGQPADAPIWCAMYDSLGTYGVLSCGATSNSELNIDAVGDLPTACPSEYLISVTATDDGDVRQFSGYGQTTIDLGAPGDQVYLAGNTTYGNTSGTSFASPCVAGGVALLYSAPCTSIMAIAYADPAMAASMVKGYVLDGVDAVSNLTTETLTGGRLNVNNSLNLLIENCSNGDCIAPFALNATQTPGSTTYTLSWAATDDMSNFTIQYRIQGGEWIEIDNLSATNYLFENLQSCTFYEFQVSAACSESTSDWSTIYLLQTDGCCVNPNTIEVSSITASSATITWNQVLAADTYTLVYMPDLGFETIVEDIAGTSHTLNNLDACTDYTVYVYAGCVGIEIPPPTPVSFNTFGCGACQDFTYCEVSGNSQYEYIERVQLNDLDNTSASDGGYMDFTPLGTTLEGGETYSITCTPGFSGGAYSEYFKVWIDYNVNGVFDTNELVFDAGAASNAAVTGEFTVPTNVTANQVKMRVAMAYVGMFGGGNPPSNCGDLGFGEAEDYCITLDPNVSVGEIKSNSNGFSLYPNPSTGMIQWTSTKPITSLTVFNAVGQRCFILENMETTMSSVDLNALESGIYMVKATNGVGDVFITNLMIQR